MVNLTRIYTRTGDAGNTRLSDASEVEGLLDAAGYRAVLEG